MTAINDKGQVYFTFEDLEIESCLNEVIEKVEDLREKHRSYCTVICDLNDDGIELTNSQYEFYLKMHDIASKYYDELKILQDIQRYLINLMNGRNFLYRFNV